MGFKSLHICNFRAINDLKVDDFAQVNIFTGANNCGKTSILEALFLLSGMSNPQLSLLIHQWRGLSLHTNDDFSFLFRDMDFSHEVKIEGLLEGQLRTLHIKPPYIKVTANNKFVIGDKVEFTVKGTRATITGLGSDVENTTKAIPPNSLLFEFSENQAGPKYVSSISLNDGSMEIPQPYKEPLRCAYNNTKIAPASLPKSLEAVFVNKDEKLITSTLRVIDERIVPIKMGAGNMIFADIGIRKLIPINLMGEGITRVLSILADMTAVGNGVLLVAEIENGLHHTSLKALWTAVFLSVKKHNVQIFLTTHSDECVAAMEEARQAAKFDDVMMYRISRKGDTHKPVSYTPDLISGVIEDNYEFR